MMILLPTVVVVVLVGDYEDVSLYFWTDISVAPNDVGHRRLFQCFNLIMPKDVAVKETVSVPQSFELIDENGLKQFPNHCATAMILG